MGDEWWCANSTYKFNQVALDDNGWIKLRWKMEVQWKLKWNLLESSINWLGFVWMNHLSLVAIALLKFYLFGLFNNGQARKATELALKDNRQLMVS